MGEGRFLLQLRDDGGMMGDGLMGHNLFRNLDEAPIPTTKILTPSDLGGKFARRSLSTQLSVSVVPTAAVAVRVVVSTNAAVGPTTCFSTEGLRDQLRQ